MWSLFRTASPRSPQRILGYTDRAHEGTRTLGKYFESEGERGSHVIRVPPPLILIEEELADSLLMFEEALSTTGAMPLGHGDANEFKK